MAAPDSNRLRRWPLGAAWAAALLVATAHPGAARAQEAPVEDGLLAGDALDELDRGEADAEAPQELPPEPAAEPDPRAYDDGLRATLAGQSAGPSMEEFHSSLDPAGQWSATPEYGTVWRPAEVGADWRPYSVGRWAYTGYGWTWVSDEPWGWAVFHYGRWALLPGTGWVWIPGRLWGPAWVAWRWGNGFAGWCPLGPRGRVNWRDERWWSLVEQRHFASRASDHLIPSADRSRVLGQMAPVRDRSVGFYRGPLPARVSSATGRRVEQVRLEVERAPGPVRPTAGGGDRVIRLFRPESSPIVRTPPPSRWNGTGRPRTEDPQRGQPDRPLRVPGREPTEPPQRPMPIASPPPQRPPPRRPVLDGPPSRPPARAQPAASPPPQRPPPVASPAPQRPPPQARPPPAPKPPQRPREDAHRDNDKR